MVREQVSLLAAAWGLIGLAFPPGIIEFPPIRSMGAVYLLAGGLVAANVYADRPNWSWNVFWVLLACSVGLWIVAPEPSLGSLAPVLCILFPFAVGAADSMESISLSAAAAFLLITVGMSAYDPPSWNDMGNLTIAFIAGQWGVFGIPLYFVGREWQGGVSNADDLSGDAGDDDEVSASGWETTTTVSKEPAKEDGLDTRRAMASGVMGMIVGAVVTYSFTNIGGGPIWFSLCFLITLSGVGYFLYSRQETTKLVVGMGLYIMALWMPLAPIILYVPLVAEIANSDIGSWGALWVGIYIPIYAFGGTIIGLMLASIGYVIRDGERE
jgi:hypothetical protein